MPTSLLLRQATARRVQATCHQRLQGLGCGTAWNSSWTSERVHGLSKVVVRTQAVMDIILPREAEGPCPVLRLDQAFSTCWTC